MKTIVILSLMSIFFIIEDPIKEIDSYCRSLAQEIEDCQFNRSCNLSNSEAFWTVEDGTWRRVQQIEKRVVFWYNDAYLSCQNCPQGGKEYLYKVSVDQQYKAQNIKQELIYKDGSLVFFCEKYKVGNDTKSRCFYFDKSTLIRYMEDGQVMNSKIEDIDWKSPLDLGNDYQSLFIE